MAASVPELATTDHRTTAAKYGSSNESARQRVRARRSRYAAIQRRRCRQIPAGTVVERRVGVVGDGAAARRAAQPAGSHAGAAVAGGRGRRRYPGPAAARAAGVDRRTAARYVLRSRLTISDDSAQHRIYGLASPDACPAAAGRRIAYGARDQPRMLLLQSVAEPPPQGATMSRDQWRATGHRRRTAADLWRDLGSVRGADAQPRLHRCHLVHQGLLHRPGGDRARALPRPHQAPAAALLQPRGGAPGRRR